MKKPELLSPVGNFESLKAAILAGCDAVYLGGKLFGARAFSNNFTDDELIEAIKYAHLYGVKVYVTVNTLIYENEVEKFMEYIDFLYKNNVDALIIQDIGMMDLIRKTYPLLELHASTQMHIHNLEGVKLVEKLGLKRVVLARETSIDLIKKIKENTNIELEIFIHGALCISYSGQCLFSSLIGNRSGNRGSCAGSCRQKYNLIVNNRKVNEENYLLSSKDLCSLENIGKLIDIGVDSLKIEGRMKSPSYVYLVTKLYRKAIDSYLKEGKVEVDLEELNDLKKVFNRNYTKGFLFNEYDIVNSYRPNHLGIEVGKVIKSQNNYISIMLTDDLNINDGIRFIDDDIGFIVTNILKNKKRVNHAKKGDVIEIYYCGKVSKTKVVKTTDYLVNKKIEQLLNQTRKIKINGSLKANIGKPLSLKISDGVNEVIVISNIVEKAITSPISIDRIKEQLNKLGNTIYEFDDLEIINDENIFISIKELNDLKNKAIKLLNEKRLYKNKYLKKEYKINIPDFICEQNYNILVEDLKTYEKIKDNDYKYIYMNNDLYDKVDDNRKVLKLSRVLENHQNYNCKLLVGEFGSLNYQDIMTDFSLNVTNSYTVAFLHSLGVAQVTLSYELTDTQIKNLIDGYKKRYNKHPNLELIVYGKEEVMISKYNINKKYNVNKSILEDRFKNKYPIIIKDNLMYIYNYKKRDLNNHKKYFEMGINNLRYNLDCID